MRTAPSAHAAAALPAVALAVCALAQPVHGQFGPRQASVWLDASAAHSRPPASAAVDPASYGLLGLRLRVDGPGPIFEAGGTAGRGAADGSGAWANGRVALSAGRVAGLADFGLRTDATGLTYLTPVQLHDGTGFTQRAASATVAPYAGISVRGFRLGGELQHTRGAWRTEVETPGIIGPPLGPVLPGGPQQPQPRTETTSGAVVITGGSAALLRVAGPATVEVRGSALDVRNAISDGTWAGVDASAVLSLGPADVMVAGRYWNSPVQAGELGGHFGFGIGLGDAAYLQVIAGRTVTDPMHALPGATSFSANVALRMGRAVLGPPLPATLGAHTATGRRVVFTLVHRNAQSVAVAGDFSDWETRPLVRSADGRWTLDTVLPPGVYHYAFVIDGEDWMVPDSATGIVDDGFGSRNATLIVTD
jgi:hypothetical protein